MSSGVHGALMLKSLIAMKPTGRTARPWPSLADSYPFAWPGTFQNGLRTNASWNQLRSIVTTQ